MRSLNLSPVKRFVPLFFFAVAMGYLEAAVVIYLREIWYPDGFYFPLKILPLTDPVLLTEVGREAATIVILIAVAIISGRTGWQKVAYFFFLFGIWDISYYIWLKILINWPPSLGTWDILFLLPIVLVGPVYAPVVVSVTIIFVGMTIVLAEKKGIVIKTTLGTWLIIVFAFILISISFITNTEKALSETEEHFFYLWPLLLVGEIAGIATFLYSIGDLFRKKPNSSDLYVSRKI